MLKRFYFDLVCRERVIPDDTGIEAADLDEALEEAEAALQEMRRSGEASEFDEGWSLLIRDEGGAALRKLPILIYLALTQLMMDAGEVFVFFTEA
ncbi:MULTISPECIES: DUF6894 family protein [Methylobacterium]|uniref:DUF6894 family protein n=1 Tax=Methylobacterium TaxID=407 RepID=UPI0014042982|nr:MULTISPECIES: hypothetical protein [Methylobacterium]MDR7040170.1 hypothetical protein [Methylobacterium sp. BE186]